MKTPQKRIRVTEPSITRREIRFVTKAITDGWGINAYTYVKRFEEEFATYIGVNHAIATSSCTGALHVALTALGVGKDDEVIIPDITWAATAFAVHYVGAKPVFADMLSDTWCIDPSKIEKLITRKTKAIIPVHIYGHPADMDAINRIAKKHRLFVIEDAAESVGATYNGKKTGSMSDFSAFSFHGTKTITTGEGGMLLTNDKALFEKATFLANMGKSTTKIFWNDGIGLKYKMSDIQAALGSAQLSRVNELLDKKRQIYQWYAGDLLKIEGISMNAQAQGCTNSYWMPTVIWDKRFKKDKEYVMKALVTYNIDPRPFFYPLTQMPPFESEVSNPISYDVSQRGINLPCGYSLTKRDAQYVSRAFLRILYGKS